MGFILYQPVASGSQSIVAPKEDPTVLKELWRWDQVNRGALCGAGSCGGAGRNDRARLCTLDPGHAETRPPQPSKLEPKPAWEEGNQYSEPLRSRLHLSSRLVGALAC